MAFEKAQTYLKLRGSNRQRLSLGKLRHRLAQPRCSSIQVIFDSDKA